MAFPTQREMLSVGLARAQSQANSLKRIAQNNRDRMAAGNISGEGLLSLLDNLRGARDTFQAVRQLPGMAAYATAQLGEDVTADFVAMENATTSAGSAILPLIRVGGNLITQQIDAAGVRSEIEFTPAQTASIRTELDTLIAAID